MAQDSQNVRKSIHITPQATPDLSEAGDIGVDSSDSNRLQYNDGTGTQRVLLQADADAGAFTDAQNVDYDPTASGLTATDVQDALDEIVSDTQDLIDAAATTTATNLATHASDTSTHGVGEIVGTTESQTLTNKTLTTPVINTPTVIEYILADNSTNLTILGGATNRNINVQTQGTGDINLTSGGEISLNGIEINNSNQIIATASSDLEIRAKTGQNTKLNANTGVVKLQAAGLDIATVSSPGITLATGKTLLQGTGTTTLNTTGAITIPSATDTLVGKATTDTLTNKTLTSPVINTPTGIVKGDVGLGNVDNTSDANKPVSTATQTALNLKANLASPALTGTPTAPTAAGGTNTTQLATTAFVTSAVASGGGSLVLLQTQTASNSATIDFTSNITSTYDQYKVVISGVVPATNATDLWIRCSENGGSSYTATAYAYSFVYSSGAGAPSSTGSSGSDTKMNITGSLGNGTGQVFACDVKFYTPASSKYKLFNWSCSYISSVPSLITVNGGGAYTSTTNAINAIRFMMSSGNITAGTFSLYGLVK